MFSPRVDGIALTNEAKRLERKAWRMLLLGMLAVPGCAVIFIVTIFSESLGESGMFAAAVVFLLPMLVVLVATPVLTVTWSVRSYRADRRALELNAAARPLWRLMPIAFLCLPVVAWFAWLWLGDPLW